MVHLSVCNLSFSDEESTVKVAHRDTVKVHRLSHKMVAAACPYL